MLTDRLTRQFVKPTVDCPLTIFGLAAGAVFNGGCFVLTFVRADNPSLTL